MVRLHAKYIIQLTGKNIFGGLLVQRYKKYCVHYSIKCKTHSLGVDGEVIQTVVSAVASQCQGGSIFKSEKHGKTSYISTLIN